MIIKLFYLSLLFELAYLKKKNPVRSKSTMSGCYCKALTGHRQISPQIIRNESGSASIDDLIRAVYRLNLKIILVKERMLRNAPKQSRFF